MLLCFAKSLDKSFYVLMLFDKITKCSNLSDNRLYWSDSTRMVIESCKYNEPCSETLVTFMDTPVEPYDILIDGEFLYYNNMENGYRYTHTHARALFSNIMSNEGTYKIKTSFNASLETLRNEGLVVLK